MRILLVNDDGYDSKGITMLAKALMLDHEVAVCAPITNSSGYAHALSFRRAVGFEMDNSYPYTCYKIYGTPADCAKIGAEKLFIKPDIIIGGINDVPNLGTDAIYSGTVNIATEATLLGIPAVALSAKIKCDADWDTALLVFKRYFSALLDLLKLGRPLSVNINVKNPDSPLKPAKLGFQRYCDEYIETEDNSLPNPHILTGKPILHELNDEDSDIMLFKRGFHTITPISVDWTEYTALQAIRKKL